MNRKRGEIMMEKVSLMSDGQYALSLAVFATEGARAVIQMVHGMEEHKERYYDFIRYLTEHHYAVVISDLRGHGSDAPVLSHIADEHGARLLVQDQQKITEWITEHFPGLPLILFGHSMGTIIARVLLQTDSAKYAAVALSGYVNPNPASSVAVMLGKMMKGMKGSRGHSKMLNNLALGSFAKSIKDRKTDLDWLSHDEENVKRYIENPLCGSEFTVGSFQALFELLQQMGKTAGYQKVRRDLPVLLISGKDDPCTGGDKGRESSRSVLSGAGFQNISVITYDHMRHEILNETDYQKVYSDLRSFFDDHSRR